MQLLLILFILSAEKVPASIILLHVPSKKIVGYYQQADRRTIINSISFSKLTGELLVSISNRSNLLFDLISKPIANNGTCIPIFVLQIMSQVILGNPFFKQSPLFSLCFKFVWIV